mgnify:CR=1 FL=1
MANPTASAVHVNTPLTNISVAYSQQADKFVAHRVFPVVPVAKQSDRYYEYSKDDWLRSEAQLRAPGSESAGGGYRLTNTSTYFCAVNAIHKDVDDQIRANADPVINMDRDATEYITQQLLMKREKDWVSSFFQLLTWTGSTTDTDIGVGTGITTAWDATSTPITDIALQAASIMKKTGYYPNTLVITPDVYNALINNDDIVDRIKYTQKGVVGRDLLANVLGLDRVEVCWATNNTAKEGATASMSFINSSTWSGYTGSQDGLRMSRFRMDQLRADRVEGELAYAQKLIGADLGVYFNNIIS